MFNRFMLTQGNSGEIEKIVEEKLEDKTSRLPTKDEFFGKMDEVMGELKTIRDEQGALSGINAKVNDHDERMVKIEKKLRIQTPA